MTGSERPQGVRIVHGDGSVTPVELAYRGLDPDQGVHVWECVTPLRPDWGDRLRVAVLPPRTTISLPVEG